MAIDLSSLLVDPESCDQFGYHYELIIADRLTQRRVDWFKANGWVVENGRNDGLLVFRKPKVSGDRGRYDF